MAFIPAPGVAQVRLTGTVGSHPWAVVLHWYAGVPSAWTQSQVTALATSARSRWDTSIGPLMGNNVRTIQSDSVDLSDSTLRAGSTPPTSTAGGTPNPTPTLAACILVSHHVGARYRGGHPRTYIPGSGTANTADGDTWAGGFVSTVTTNWTAFKNGVTTDLNAAGLASAMQCAPRYTYNYTADNVKHKFIKTRQTFLGPFPVQTFTVSTQIATQRRRLG